ncbi:MAG: hypothetical protein M3497_01615 [Gemmatimonadota bacterium]|nr:hypothetical protein [Gemmatimonadota bacterium]
MQSLEEKPDAGSTRSFSDRLLGFVGGGLLLLALAVAINSLVRGNSSEAQLSPAQPLVLAEPRNGATVSNPVELLFTTGAALTQTPMGWGAESLHLHAAVNGQDVMPAGPEITSLGSERYRWMLRLPGPGNYTLRLFWSGPDHAPLAEGASEAIRIRVDS